MTKIHWPHRLTKIHLPSLQSPHQPSTQTHITPQANSKIQNESQIDATHQKPKAGENWSTFHRCRSMQAGTRRTKRSPSCCLSSCCLPLDGDHGRASSNARRISRARKFVGIAGVVRAKWWESLSHGEGERRLIGLAVAVAWLRQPTIAEIEVRAGPHSLGTQRPTSFLPSFLPSGTWGPP